ncbi:MAG: hypothetical protein LBH91_00520 [Prevotellaceae bacterium]|jgi:hypothetical protein|nr:hypothetical protein [Prevotellaceae bacterium]
MDGIVQCAKCGVALVDESPPETEVEKKLLKIRLATFFNSEIAKKITGSLWFFLLALLIINLLFSNPWFPSLHRVLVLCNFPLSLREIINDVILISLSFMVFVYFVHQKNLRSYLTVRNVFIIIAVAMGIYLCTFFGKYLFAIAYSVSNNGVTTVQGNIFTGIISSDYSGSGVTDWSVWSESAFYAVIELISLFINVLRIIGLMTIYHFAIERGSLRKLVFGKYSLEFWGLIVFIWFINCLGTHISLQTDIFIHITTIMAFISLKILGLIPMAYMFIYSKNSNKEQL